jgi:hypothetical protein
MEKQAFMFSRMYGIRSPLRIIMLSSFIRNTKGY